MRIVLLLLMIHFISCNQINNRSTVNVGTDYNEHVGDILFDPDLDDPRFQLCNEDRTLVHYNFNNPDLYKGEKHAIDSSFENFVLPKSTIRRGYVTIRFAVNCKAQTGRFRIEQLDFNYNSITYEDEVIDALLSKVKSLNNWIPAEYNGKVYDYYKYLTFKIVDHKIVDILP